MSGRGALSSGQIDGGEQLKGYFVSWEIDVEAGTAREAAEEALKIQRDPTSIATVFGVIEHDTDKQVKVDLQVPPSEEEIKERLEYLRGELRAERISYSGIAELQDLIPYIDASDVELREAAGVPEFEDECPNCHSRNTAQCGDDQECHDCGKLFSESKLPPMPITESLYKRDLTRVNPGFEVVGKSVVHVQLLKVDGIESPAFMEFCKCRSEEWAARVSSAMNQRFPKGEIPE